MDTYLLDWLNLLLRWVHVITAIAWVGSSFYFVWLDNNLVKPTAPELTDKGVGGALWAVHGGGFYNPQKYLGAPPNIDFPLQGFYWESYSTWLTGFALFTALYLWNAATFLVDKSVFDWAPWLAGTVALALLAGFWFVYDAICRVLGRSEAAVSVAVAAVVLLAAWLACQLYAGRAAFLIVGAMVATAMSANVLFVIIPGQRKVVAALTEGRPVDPLHGQRVKQRSVHNTYFTLPVLVAMLSNHYWWLYQGRWNWLVLAALMAAGALIRHSFVARHQARQRGERAPWQWAGLGVVLLVLPAVLFVPAPRTAAPLAAAAPDAAAIRALLEQRCTLCHNAQLAQKSVALHTPDLVAQQALSIYQQVVVTRQMPLNNATGITEAERTLVERWFKAGAPTR